MILKEQECEPKVSVIMPVYNADDHFREAIESILQQTYKNIEFIVVNDGSDDGGYTESVALEYGERIRYYYKPNSGVADTLNYALRLCTGEFIARMDADDISKPERIKKQVSFLMNNPQITVCGTQISVLRGDSLSGFSYPVEDSEIIAEMLFRNALCHPSVMLRGNAVYGKWWYDTDTAAEDYDLWTRMLSREKMANLPEELLIYRCSTQSVTATRAECITHESTKIIRGMLNRVWKIDASGWPDYVVNINELKYQAHFDILDDLYNGFKMLKEIDLSNKKYHLVADTYFKELLQRQWELRLRLYHMTDIVWCMCGSKFEKSIMSTGTDVVEETFDMMRLQMNSYLATHEKINLAVCALGTRGRRFIDFIENDDVSEKFIFSGFADNKLDYIVAGGTKHRVERVRDIMQIKFDLVVVTSNQYFNELKEELILAGVNSDRIRSDDYMYLMMNMAQMGGK